MHRGARDIILARRARFCAVALATAGLAGCATEKNGEATPEQDAETAAPEACLMVIDTDIDTSWDTSSPVDAPRETGDAESETGDAATDADG